MKKVKSVYKDTGGDAVVEAAILFPIIVMIFAGLVMLSMYLPQRAVLQEAAQFAAVCIATEQSDTWLKYDDAGNPERKSSDLNVYKVVFDKVFLFKSGNGKTEKIVKSQVNKGIPAVPIDSLNVEVEFINYVVYQEVVVTVSQTVKIVGLPFIGFPEEITLTQEARAVVQDGDEFVRNVDIAKDVVIWIDKKLGISGKLKDTKVFEGINKVLVFFELK